MDSIERMLLEALGLEKAGNNIGTDQTMTFEVVEEDQGDYEVTVQEHTTGDERKFVVAVWEQHE